LNRTGLRGKWRALTITIESTHAGSAVARCSKNAATAHANRLHAIDVQVTQERAYRARTGGVENAPEGLVDAP
jgi:hypothetical protein